MTPPNQPLATYLDDPPSDGQTMRERRYYRAYGLTVASDVALPELEPTEPAAADILIAIGTIDLPKPSPEAATIFRFEPDRQYLAWHAVGAFLPIPLGPSLRGRARHLEPLGGTGDRPAVIDDATREPQAAQLGQRSVSVGHEDLLVGET